MIICLIILDQTIKSIVVRKLYNSSITILDGVLNFTYVENTGGAFGIGSNNTIMFVVVNIIVLTLIAKLILSRKNEISKYMLMGLGLILAGGIGNLADRIFRGFVIDYIDFNPLIKYPAFNMADVCVVLGGIVVGINVIADMIKDMRNVGAHDCARKR